MSDPLLGKTIGRFEIVDRIGAGGMGVVYRGRQMSLNRAVAIKFLPLQMAVDDEFVRRFRQEAEVIAGLAHENIVYVYDIDQHEGTWYIVMEYIDGHSLRQLRGDQAFSADEVRALGIPLARALDYAHQRGIVHRDIKSANVMVTQEGKVKLMDFGIAKAAGGGVKTITGSVLGTPEYMSPEQARSGRVTAQSDVYSLGVLLYELSTGTLPFRADDPFAVALKHVSEPPEPPSARSPHVPAWLESIILRAMAKETSERYATAAEVEHDLLRAGADSLTDPTGAHFATDAPTLARYATAPAAAAGGATPAPTPPPAGAPPVPGPATPAGAAPAAGPATPSPLVTPMPGPSGQPHTPTPPPTPPPVPPGTAMPPGVGATMPETPGLGATVPGGAAPGSAVPGSSVPVAPTPVGPHGRVAASGPDRRPLWIGGAAAAAILLLALSWWMFGGGDATPPASPTAPPTTAELPATVAAGGGPSLRVPQGPPTGPVAPELSEEEKLQIEVGLLLDRAEGRLAAGDAAAALELAEAALHLIPEHPRAIEIRDAARAALPADVAPAPAPVPPPPPTFVATKPAPPPPVVVPPPTQAPPPPPAAVKGPSAEELWQQAREHYDHEEYHSCRDKLDRVLALDPRHKKARSWREDADHWVEDWEEEMRDELVSWLAELDDTIQDQDFGDIRVMWGERFLDDRTAQYFRDLFDQHKRLVVRSELQSATYRDLEATFVARITIESREGWRGPKSPVTTKTWRGTFRLVDGDPAFVTPFP